MNAISWNCIGLGNPRTVRALWDMVKSHKPNILFLMETLSYKERIKHLCGKMGFDNHWTVECVGRSGGIALFWKSNVKCIVCNQGINFIDVQITNVNEVKWRLTGFYGFPERARKREVWGLLKMLAGVSDLPWVVVGDFNDMVNISDKKGNYAHPQSFLDGFKRTIEECGLIELEWREKYFHAYATSRKKQNQVGYLKDESGAMINKHEEMCELVKGYFSRIFGGTERLEMNSLDEQEAVITEEHNRDLIAEFKIEEFSEAIKQMHPDKSAGPDGLNPAFYQHFWGLCGKDVFQCCKNWLVDLAFPLGLNDTNVVLIPKKDNTDEMKDLRPIALCNVLYKVISKVLANRLKEILPVAQAIPSYAMSCFLLPKSLCIDLERMMNSYFWGSQEDIKKGIRWTSWTNMSMSKEQGGLAFHDLHGLWQAKESQKQGYRWVVGDGRSINLGADKWLRGKEGHRVDEQCLSLVRNLKVCDLFVSGTKEWDVTKVHNLFSSSDARFILAIPIPNNQFQDRIVWNYSLDGKYSAKSGYRFWQQHYSQCK
ncbi:uncharacterized protein LOC141696006 [Apium graveolens]|uniref:uncharacterized protein LOC141696006 n=1 Tax=Apium graveolens TaxID=4045 RepID=UPI003D7B3BF7